MSEILFGHSYYLRFDPKLWEAMQPYPPLGTLYAAAYLRQRGYTVALFDAMLADSEAAWAQALDQEQPRFAVLYEDNFNYLSKMCLARMRSAAFAMIQMARQHNCTVIVGGADATDHADDYLAHGAHFVLIGEGEATLRELLDHLTGRSTTPLATIPGLAFLADEDITISRESKIETPRRPDLNQLDDLPFPAWDLVDVARYQAIWRQRHGYYSMNIVTTRGCPYHCNWCAKPIWGQRYHARSPEQVVAEMQWLQANFQPDHLWFADDILGIKPGWLQRFADALSAAQLQIPFKCLSRADLLLRVHKTGESDIAALRRAGCQIVWIGAESGSQAILDGMEKGTTVAQIYQASQRLHQHGLQVGFFLQFGYPSETRADIEKTLQMVRDCQPDDIGISVAYPLPGTKFYNAVANELGDKRNWHDSSDLAMLYEGPYGTPFYRQLHTVLHKEYRARKTWQHIRQQVHGVSPRRLAAMLYHWATLPLARWRLNQLAQLSPQGLRPLHQRLSQAEAATPTPQCELAT
jgi:anaerobic magnesium-protoporphyrin IX monomethyl ester cyclase